MSLEQGLAALQGLQGVPKIAAFVSIGAAASGEGGFLSFFLF